ncbi:hypothetical protein BCON_0258g00060 [Botryotinia convoluta]|uniref:Uncharacterized protein n=1 Tax=Botryotinia convoluta TaxID=54673 RepID=A0A4Z1HSU5_9HELO|nr:hypothetical protein BCON_0258g00060 [Botryotinia convoluta]
MALHALVALLEPITGINYIKFSYPSATFGSMSPQRYSKVSLSPKKTSQEKEIDVNTGHKMLTETRPQVQ